MKVGLYLIGAKGFSVLDRLLGEYGASSVAFVIAAQDTGTEEDFFNEIEELCIKSGIYFSKKNHENKELIQADYFFAVGWRWLISDSRKLIVFHDSLLPKYRGFSPLVNMLINGEREVGVTALLASGEYDRGNILGQKSINVQYPIKIATAINMIRPIYADIAVEIYRRLYSGGEISGDPQNESLATYSLWRDEEDYSIDWNNSSVEIERFCNAVGYPYKGACTHVREEKVRIIDVESLCDVFVESRSNNIGKVIFLIDDAPVVVCGTGLLKIKNYRFECNSDKKINFRTRFTSLQKW